MRNPPSAFSAVKSGAGPIRAVPVEVTAARDVAIPDGHGQVIILIVNNECERMTHLLTAGDWGAVIDPQGGLIRSLTLRGRSILRPMADQVSDAVHAACFPLLPFANRLEGAVLRIGDRTARPPPANPERHALHGFGWRSLWTPVFDNDSAAELILTGGGDDAWPWRWRAIQRFSRYRDGLRIALVLTNEDSVAMPASIGLHPAFVMAAGTSIELEVSGVWDCDRELIPTAWRHADWTSLRDHPIDNCLTGWIGQARLRHADGLCVTLTADTNHLHVYRPHGSSVICLEPVSARPNAWTIVPGSNEGPPPMLAPGRELSVVMEISADGGGAG
jgi:aldose 1-epimerase